MSSTTCLRGRNFSRNRWETTILPAGKGRAVGDAPTMPVTVIAGRSRGQLLRCQSPGSWVAAVGSSYGANRRDRGSQPWAAPTVPIAGIVGRSRGQLLRCQSPASWAAAAGRSCSANSRCRSAPWARPPGSDPMGLTQFATRPYSSLTRITSMDSSASRYSSTTSSGTGPSSAVSQSRMSLTVRVPSTKFSAS